MLEKTVGVIVALKLEGLMVEKILGSLEKKVSLGRYTFYFYKNKKTTFILVYSGVGEILSSIATTLLINHFGASLIINFGLCGSLSSSLKSGNVVLVKEIVHYDFHPDMTQPEREAIYLGEDSPVFTVSYPDFLNSLSIYPFVRIASGDKFISSGKMKNYLFNRFDCLVCDMESAGINLACSQLNVDRIFIKAISDNADETASLLFEDSIKNGVSAYEHLILLIVKNLNE